MLLRLSDSSQGWAITGLVEALDDRFEQVVDRAVARRRDAHPLTLVHERADDVRTRVCLARAGRTLDGHVAVIEVRRPPTNVGDVARERAFGGTRSHDERGQR